jgi:excisionase family DNA binding protein
LKQVPESKFFDNSIRGNEWLTTEQAAHLLSISANALRIMAHRGQIQVYKFRRRLRFKAEDCLALIQKKGLNNGN